MISKVCIMENSVFIIVLGNVDACSGGVANGGELRKEYTKGISAQWETMKYSDVYIIYIYI